MTTVNCNDYSCKNCDVNEWECVLDEIHLKALADPDNPHGFECLDWEEREAPEWEGEDKE